MVPLPTSFAPRCPPVSLFPFSAHSFYRSNNKMSHAFPWCEQRMNGRFSLSTPFFSSITLSYGLSSDCKVDAIEAWVLYGFLSNPCLSRCHLFDFFTRGYSTQVIYIYILTFCCLRSSPFTIPFVRLVGRSPSVDVRTYRSATQAVKRGCRQALLNSLSLPTSRLSMPSLG